MGQTNDKSKPVRSNGRRAAGAARFNDVRFVQYELDASEQAQCKGWDVDEAGIWLEILALVDDGYSVTVKFDAFTSAYACFLQVRGDDTHVNANLILSGRGSVPWKAVKQAVFKHRAIGASWIQFAERVRPAIDD